MYRLPFPVLLSILLALGCSRDAGKTNNDPDPDVILAPPVQGENPSRPPTSPRKPVEISAFTPVLALAFSPDGNQLASGHGIDTESKMTREALILDPTVRIWNLEDPNAEPRVLTHEFPVHGVAWSPDGGRIACLQRGALAGPTQPALPPTLVLWNSAGKKEKAWHLPFATTAMPQLARENSLICSLAFLSDGRHLLIDGPETYLVDTSAGSEVKEWPKSLPSLRRPERKYPNLLVPPPLASPDGRLRLHVDGPHVPPVLAELEGTRPLHSFRSDMHWTRALAYAPDGKRVAAGGNTGNLRHFHRALPDGQGNYIGRPVPTGPGFSSFEGYVALWDPATGKLVREIRTVPGSIPYAVGR